MFPSNITTNFKKKQATGFNIIDYFSKIYVSLGIYSQFQSYFLGEDKQIFLTGNSTFIHSIKLIFDERNCPIVYDFPP